MQRTATLIVFAGLLSASAFAQGPLPNDAPIPAPIAGQPPEYAAGLKAMNESRWQEALADFDKVHGAGDDFMAQALYWKAYNLQKLDRNEESTNACRELARKYSGSSWVSECFQLRASKVRIVKDRNFDIQTGSLVDMDQLQVQLDQLQEQAQMMADRAGRTKEPFLISGPGGPHDFTIKTSKIDPNDEIKLIALNSLMQQEPDKALPLLRAFLASDKPVEVRRRAMFVLEQSKSPEAQKLLADIATYSKDPELQRAAVWAVASHAKDHTAELVAIYKGNSDHEVKRAAASGLRSAFDTKDLIELARTETDPDMKRRLVDHISEMHDPEALPYLEELAK